MALLAPLYFYLGLVGALLVVGLHCIVTRQPPSAPFPTVRFVPIGSAQVTRLSRPEDLPLLLVRVLAVLSVGLAFAHPVLLPERVPVRRIVLLDHSLAVANQAQARDSARSVLNRGDFLIPFDSTANTGAGSDQVDGVERSRAAGRLTPALIAALRLASRVRRSADSLELIVVSPLQASEFDAATASVRALWPGRIRAVLLAPASDSSQRRSVDLRAETSDGVWIAAALAGLRGSGSATRLIRRPMTTADSLWSVQQGHTLIRWDSIPRGPWRSRIPADTANAVVAGETALVFPLLRAWRAIPGPGVRVVARWVDGEPAALEQDLGQGCVRDIAIVVPATGDLILRLPFRHLVETLLAPCHVGTSGPVISTQQRGQLEGQGALARSRDFAPPQSEAASPVAWLLIVALLLLALEQWLRRGSAITAQAGAALQVPS